MEYNYSVADVEHTDVDGSAPDIRVQNDLARQLYITDFYEKLRKTEEAKVPFDRTFAYQAHRDHQAYLGVQPAQVEPLVQHAQKCAWCGKYLTDGSISVYDGPVPEYKYWMCHAECNMNPITSASLTAQSTQPAHSAVQSGKTNQSTQTSTQTDNLDEYADIDIEAQRPVKKETPKASLSSWVFSKMLGSDE